jgi:hypothetical protein
MKCNNYFTGFLGLILTLIIHNTFAQHVEKIYKPYIRTAQLFSYGNQQGLPLYKLGGGNKLELEFDDMDANYKNYYYTYVLCDYNWKPANLSAFDYIKGFTQNRITIYRYSNIAFTRYTHYQAFFPDQNSVPTRSGNYLLKVYLDGDTSKLVFTKQFLVLDQKALVTAEVVQPFTPQLFSTHQRLRFSANIKDINTFSAAQQVKAVILQNNRWDISKRDIIPTYVRGNVLEYNSENIGVFAGGKEWRWLVLRSFLLQSDRVDSGTYDKDKANFFLKPDIDRTGDRYVYFPDYNGMYNIITYESINPFWQGDYANIHFYFKRKDGLPYPDDDIYLAGGFTNFELNDKWKMTFNLATGQYEVNAFLKQGYYNYTYFAVNKSNPTRVAEMEGNYWETENAYTILIYYKSFTDRNDQLIGVTTINSRTDKPGFSF